MNIKAFLKHLIPASLARLQRLQRQYKALKKETDALKTENKNLLLLIEDIQNHQKKLESDIKYFSEKSKKAEIDARYCKSILTEQAKIAKHDYLKSSPESVYIQELSDWFTHATGETLELDNPKTFNQKVQWLKLFDTTPLKTQLSDKYLVRDWVREKIGDKYLTELLGVWDNFDDIDFSLLPERFVLKGNHGCAFNYIVPDKSKLNISDARYKFTSWMKINYAYRGFEPQYLNIKPVIIAEEYLENDGDDLYDYKIWCFGGEPKFIQFIRERNKGGTKMAYFDTDWNKQPFVSNNIRIEDEIEKPKNLDEMLEIARILSKDFCYVCVDLYHLNDGTIKFGEMTFTRANGACHWNPPEYNTIIGDMITLPEKKPFFKES